MKTRTRISVAVAAVLAIGLLAWALAPRPLEVELATVTTGHFETTVDEDGKTRLRPGKKADRQDRGDGDGNPGSRLHFNLVS